MAAVDVTKERIQAGDIFQLVLSQRFERRTRADPFEIYRCCCPLLRSCVSQHPLICVPLLKASFRCGAGSA